MKKRFMFHILVINDRNIAEEYRTNAILSKNDGALIAFADENGVTQNLDPTLIYGIKITADPITHIAELFNV